MIETVLLFCLFIFILYVWKFKRPNNFPPGPEATPFIGNTIDLPEGTHFHERVEEYGKKYGPVIGLRFFTDYLVVVTGVDSVLAALRHEDFQSRPDTFSLRDRSFGKNLGIFFSFGEQWASSRKFTIKQLKAFGKNNIDDIITDEISLLMETFKDGAVMQGNGSFGLAAVNVIWRSMSTKRMDMSDPKSVKFLELINSFFRRGNPSGASIVNAFPIVRFFSKNYKLQQESVKEVQEFIRREIQEHREILDPKNPIDFIDNYLVEMEKQKKYFTEEDLIMIGFDMFTAGAESTSNSVEFVLLYMILYPDVQARVQKELDQVLARSRKPVLEDKNKMHYTMAVLNEVERLNSIAPTTPMHCAIRDTTFGGYSIPKDTMVSINMHSLGNDPKYWKNPEEFNPDRFLNANGHYTKSPILHSFGLGVRTCVGEMMAKNSIFLFITTFLEKYTVSLPPGEPKPSTKALPGFTTAPQPFKIQINSRY